MITDTMSRAEIARIYDRVLEEHPFRFEDLDHHKIRRFFIKNKNATNVFMKPRRFRIDRNAVLYMMPVLINKQRYESGKADKLTFMVYRSKHGLEVVKKRYDVYENRKLYTFVNSHFFDRFRERHLQDSSVSKLNTIIEFYKRNFRGDTVYIYSANEHGVAEFVSVYDTGMAFGTVESTDICVYKTYIDPSDMTETKKGDFKILNWWKTVVRSVWDGLSRPTQHVPTLKELIDSTPEIRNILESMQQEE